MKKIEKSKDSFSRDVPHRKEQDRQKEVSIQPTWGAGHMKTLNIHAGLGIAPHLCGWGDESGV